MMRLRATHAKLALSALGLAVLTGCASVSLEQNIGRVNDEAGNFTDGKLALARTQEERDQRAQAAQTLLAETLNQKDAVQLALVNSPSLQTLLAQGWGESADAAQVGRIANPIFSFERMTAGAELDLGRALSFGLLDLLTLPSRYGVATRRIEQSQLRLTSDVVDQVTRVRQAWVRAVAAQQSLKYAKQVYESAEAGAELAKRMQSVGNFNRITRAREQAFYADAATRLSTAQHQVTASREELVRLLGLDESQAQALKLPERLPDLPMQALDPQAVGSLATKARLDIRLAQTALDGAAKAQGLNMVTSFTDIELTGRRNTTFDNAEGTRSTARGWEIAVRLPIFDWGGIQRDAMNARTLAAANQLEATVRAAGSSLRESYSAYRTAYDVARHHRDEVVPLRKVISEENQLRYNGMLISVFELLADARDQVSAVSAAIDAQQQFWLADAAMQASVIGRPTSTSLSVASSAPGGGDAGH
ncbi:TolC family protein [Acidovorax sp. BoFeN1]|uniref:TolC family protein n=1 Tax=Acidovorax sp. BoFeN1 TaxID=1231053 RepID=UPI000E097E46|nr:TolC family protein [Acidovorax sp. BoFeN1]RDD94866.1 TolC family protein [Acidovorax sp. BoFeN1]